MDGALARVAERLACPSCHTALDRRAAAFHCVACGADFPDHGTTLDLRPPALQDRGEVEAWSKHWSDENQKSSSQRFFSVYRKAIFARSVAYFVNRYFPATGVFVEAGSGTSETSMRIDKRDGGRTMVAVDLILPVLDHCHPIMDVRMGADIFNLPFADNSVDGIWNVGVMEHFTQDQIDQILREFRRVLKPGARVILLWPGTDSIPQRMLRVVEWFINKRANRAEKFRFHPDEISQLPSVKRGRETLARNGLQTVGADGGPRSLFAFKIMVGQKP